MNERLSELELKLKKISKLIQWYADDTVADNVLVLTTKAQPNEGYLKTYVLEQSGRTVGEVDIPKDFLVKSARTIYVETIDDVKKITKVNNVPQSEPYETAPAAVTGDGTWLDFVINVKSGSTVPDSHVCVKIDALIDIYTGGSGITVENNTVSLVINENGGLELNNQQLQLVVNTDDHNGLRIDTNSGLTVDLATWTDNASGGTGTNGAMSGDDKKQIIDINHDLLYDYELVSWYGFGDEQVILDRLSGITDDPISEDGLTASYDSSGRTIILTGTEQQLSYNSAASAITINAINASYDTITKTISIA